MNNPTVEKIDLFPFLKAFFADDGSWETLKNSAKMPHAFMLNRFLSIKHPEYMQCLNKQHSVHIINALHEEFKSKGKAPGWMYTKATNSKNDDHPLKKYPTILIDEFIAAHGVERKSLDFLLEFHQKEVLEELDYQLKVYNQTPKKSK